MEQRDKSRKISLYSIIFGFTNNNVGQVLLTRCVILFILFYCSYGNERYLNPANGNEFQQNILRDQKKGLLVDKLFKVWIPTNKMQSTRGTLSRQDPNIMSRGKSCSIWQILFYVLPVIEQSRQVRKCDESLTRFFDWLKIDRDVISRKCHESRSCHVTCAMKMARFSSRSISTFHFIYSGDADN